MAPSPADSRLDDETVRRLADLAAQWTGFRPDAIRMEAIRQAFGAHLAEFSPAQLIDRTAARDPLLVSALLNVVSVGETYFFRQPEHFKFITERILRPRMNANAGVQVLRAWSAGCASGEEAYSLAACLLAEAGDKTRVEVLGTDILDKNLKAAYAGAYGRWSVRASGPLLFPVFEEGGNPERQKVRGRLRDVTTFRVHNLLDKPFPWMGQFDVIFCRNVLVYFSPEAARTVCANLAKAVAPEGIIIFGTLDVDAAPPGMVRIGNSEMNAFVPGDDVAPPPPRPSVRTPLPFPGPAWPRSNSILPRLPDPQNGPVSAPAIPPGPPGHHQVVEPVALHLRALSFIERDQGKNAMQLLDELLQFAPDYLPGILERALFLAREGEGRGAAALMRELLRRTDQLSPDEFLPGPENLPVAFYRASAEAFLTREEKKK